MKKHIVIRMIMVTLLMMTNNDDNHKNAIDNTIDC